MAKIVALSGTHGTGKSSILNACEGSVRVDRTGLSRGVQAKMGKNLAEILTDADSILSFQEAIFEAMVYRDRSIMSLSTFAEDSNRYALGDSLVLVERSPYDLIAYASTWLDPIWDALIEVGDISSITRYHIFVDKCVLHAAEMYEGIVFVPAVPTIPFVADVNRGSLESRQLLEEELLSTLIFKTEFCIYDLTSLVTTDSANNDVTTYAMDSSVTSIPDRVEFTLEAIRKMVKE